MGSDKKEKKRKREKSAEDDSEGGEEKDEGAELTKKQKKKLRDEKRAAKKVVEEINTTIDTKDKDSDKKVTEAEKDHSKRLAKMLPTRQEKARRDLQNKVRIYVLELQANGTTDKKELKKLKMKYKKSLERKLPGARKVHGKARETKP